MASNTASPSLKPRRGKAKTIPSGSVSASVIPASAEEPSDVAGKLDIIMLRLEKLNVLDQLVVQVTNLTKSLEFCHESIAELKRENVKLRTRVTELGRDNTEQQRAAKADHDALVDLTWRSMRDNLLFYSIPETTNDDDCDATVQKFFRDELQASWEAVREAVWHQRADSERVAGQTQGASARIQGR